MPPNVTPIHADRRRPEVDLTHYPDYISICPRPMSLEKVEQLLGGLEDKNREYLNHGEFVCDMRLIFSNAIAYNNPDRIINELDRVGVCVFLVCCVFFFFRCAWRPMGFVE